MLTVTAKELLGGTATVTIAATATLGDLFHAVADKLGYAQASHINIISRGHKLESMSQLSNGDTVHVLPNHRGQGGMAQEGPGVDVRTLLKRKQSVMQMNPLAGSTIIAVQRTTPGENDREDGLALQIGGENDVIYAGGGPDHFELDSGGGLRVRGVDSFDDLVGKKIERVEYREWRAAGPGPAKAKQAAPKPGSAGGPKKTGPVIYFAGGGSVYAVKDAAGSEPACITFLYCDGEEGGAFETGLPSD